MAQRGQAGMGRLKQAVHKHPDSVTQSRAVRGAAVRGRLCAASRLAVIPVLEAEGERWSCAA